MEYQKIANLLNDGSNKPSKFRTRNWVQINDEARGTYFHNKQIKFKTSMQRSSLCDYSDAYILAGGNIEKIWAHQFLEKPKTIEAGGLGGAVSPPHPLQWSQGRCLGERVGANPLNNFPFFHINHAKMVIVRVNIG